MANKGLWMNDSTFNTCSYELTRAMKKVHDLLTEQVENLDSVWNDFYKNMTAMEENPTTSEETLTLLYAKNDEYSKAYDELSNALADFEEIMEKFTEVDSDLYSSLAVADNAIAQVKQVLKN